MDRDEALWIYAENRDSRFYQQLATSLIGIGALYFAYGSVPQPLIRTLIALVGLGGSIALWLHAEAIIKDRDGALEELQRSEQGKLLIKRWRRSGEWRLEGTPSKPYISTARLAAWFLFWVVCAWILAVAVSDLTALAQYGPVSATLTYLQTWGPLILTLVVLVVAVVTYHFLRVQSAINKSRTAESKSWAEPAETSKTASAQAQRTPPASTEGQKN